jgi:hypothetical protein
MAADVLTRVRAEIDARLRELRPAVAEYAELLDAADAIETQARTRQASPKPAAKRQTASKAKAAPQANAAPKADAAPDVRTEAKAKPEAKRRPTAKVAPKVRATVKAASKPKPAKPKPVATSAAEQAIVAALEHGSHTVGELGVVTAMSGGEIREGARRLLEAGKITRAKREGRAAYALSDA